MNFWLFCFKTKEQKKEVISIRGILPSSEWQTHLLKHLSCWACRSILNFKLSLQGSFITAYGYFVSGQNKMTKEVISIRGILPSSEWQTHLFNYLSCWACRSILNFKLSFQALNFWLFCFNTKEQESNYFKISFKNINVWFQALIAITGL